MAYHSRSVTCTRPTSAASRPMSGDPAAAPPPNPGASQCRGKLSATGTCGLPRRNTASTTPSVLHTHPHSTPPRIPYPQLNLDRPAADMTRSAQANSRLPVGAAHTNGCIQPASAGSRGAAAPRSTPGFLTRRFWRSTPKLCRGGLRPRAIGPSAVHRRKPRRGSKRRLSTGSRCNWTPT
jgi:hypothetical protein